MLRAGAAANRDTLSATRTNGPAAGYFRVLAETRSAACGCLERFAPTSNAYDGDAWEDHHVTEWSAIRRRWSSPPQAVEEAALTFKEPYIRQQEDLRSGESRQTLAPIENDYEPQKPETLEAR